MYRKVVFAVALLAAALAGADEVSSDEAFVFLKPEELSFWHTATNSSFMVPVLFPQGATSATIEISGGRGYHRLSPAITAESLDDRGEYRIDLPAAAGPEAENVYSLTLEFNDGTVRTARLGVISGLEWGGSGVTRCIAPKDGIKWSVKGYSAVVPVPYGTISLSVDGDAVETGLAGEQGWYYISLPDPGKLLALSLETDADVYDTVLVGKGFGGILIFR